MTDGQLRISPSQLFPTPLSVAAGAMLHFASFGILKDLHAWQVLDIFPAHFAGGGVSRRGLSGHGCSRTGSADGIGFRLVASALAVHARSRQAAESSCPLPADRYALLRHHGVDVSDPVSHAADALRHATARLGGASLALPCPASRHRNVRVRPCARVSPASLRRLSASHQPTIRTLSPALGLVVLGLGKRPTARFPHREPGGLGAVYRAAAQPTPLVVLLLAGNDPQRCFFHFRSTNLDRAAVQQIRAAYRSSRRPGRTNRACRTARGDADPATTHVRDEGQREDHAVERLCRWLWRDQARCRLGHDHGAHDYAADAICLWTR